jgi:hypothetical protein
MESESKQPTNGFLDLASFVRVTPRASINKSSVIKSSFVKDDGNQKIEILDGDSTEPTIHIQRTGEKIEHIEFICPCGKSSHVTLEYDQE